jgi:hypothetical protein
VFSNTLYSAAFHKPGTLYNIRYTKNATAVFMLLNAGVRKVACRHRIIFTLLRTERIVEVSAILRGSEETYR